MGNTFGHLFRITTFGESHGTAVGVIIDGCPPRLQLDAADIQANLDRRRPGQSALTTQRQEQDRVQVLSGIQAGQTLGTPIALMVANADARSADYAALQDVLRPSHADYTYAMKFGIRAAAGGGRASARETVGRVAAGAVARALLRQHYGIEVLAWVKQVYDVVAHIDVAEVTAAAIDANLVRCPDPTAAEAMQAAIVAAKAVGDSLGGVIQAVARHVPPGLGAPVFDKLEAELARAMLSIPACRGFEVGSGFAGAAMRGSAHNDAFVATPGPHGPRIATRTNRSGGIQGGIANGQPIVVQAAFKPTATIGHPQQTVDTAGRPVTLAAKGRHDPCVLPRAVPIVEAMFALVLADHALRHRALGGAAATPHDGA
jgi:chorismate synthase